jgi:hypothetical protein
VPVELRLGRSEQRLDPEPRMAPDQGREGGRVDVAEADQAAVAQPDLAGVAELDLDSVRREGLLVRPGARLGRDGRVDRRDAREGG